jgi:parallel beta-helix repeat protein
MKKGKPYYLADKFWMLDAPGEWYYDKGAKQLYAWLPDGSSPGQHKMEATHGDYGVYAAQKHYLVIEEMEIRNAGMNGVQLEDCLGFRVANLSIHNSGTMKFVDVWESAGDGITVTGRNNVGPEHGVISNNVIENSLCTGIRCASIQNLTVVSNTVANTGLVGSPERRRKKCRGGIIVSSGCHNALIRHNRVLDCGYNGICFTHSRDVLVEENYIKDPLWIHGDGGAIKTGHAGGGGSRIVRNITTVSSTNSMARRAARGVYLDDNSHDIQVLGNTFVNASLGIHVHNAHDHILRGNTAYACTHGLAIQEDKIVNIQGIIKNNIFENNIFFSTSTNQVFNLKGRLGHIDFGTYDHNSYSSPNPGNLVHELVIIDARVKSWKYAAETYDLASWQSVRGMDLHSRFIRQPGSSAPEEDSLILINPSVETKRFARKGHALPGRNYVDLDGKPVKWPVSVAGYGSKVLVWDGKGRNELRE